MITIWQRRPRSRPTIPGDRLGEGRWGTRPAGLDQMPAYISLLCHVMVCYVRLGYVMLYHIILYCIILYYIVLCYAILYDIIVYHYYMIL